MTSAEMCGACNTVAGRTTPPGGVIYQNEHWLVTHAFDPAPLRGLLLVTAKRHVGDLADLTLSEHATLSEALGRTAKALRDVTAPERIYAGSLGETNAHVAWQLIPRSAGMPSEAALLLELGLGRWGCSDEDAADVANRVRVAITKGTWSMIA
ncbi:MAG: HIT family protein [Dehalococcoidia bacterium]